MEPSTITLKNLPADLRKMLSERAKRNHRSLNGEILATLQASLDFEIDVEMLLAESDRFVENITFSTTPAEISRYRNPRHGRSFAPVLWRSEFRNTLASYLRRGSLGIEDAQRAYDGAAKLLRGSERNRSSSVVAAVLVHHRVRRLFRAADAVSIPVILTRRRESEHCAR